MIDQKLLGRCAHGVASAQEGEQLTEQVNDLVSKFAAATSAIDGLRRGADEEIKGLQSRLDGRTTLVQSIMARLADLLDADQFNNIEAMVLEAGVPYPAVVERQEIK